MTQFGIAVAPEVAALRAPHTGAEGRHRDVIRPGVDVDLGVVAAVQAGDFGTHYQDDPWSSYLIRRSLNVGGCAGGHACAGGA